MVLAAALIGGCAATSVDFPGGRPQAPFCQASGEALSAAVVWGPQWRPDQKDVPAREQAAEEGLAQFFATPTCFARARVYRRPGGSLGSVEEARAASAAAAAGADARGVDRVLFIVVRELGPVVKLLSSLALVEGGTEVVLDVASYDLARGGERRSSVHWRHGGAGVVKGVASLPQDMQAALAALLAPAAGAAR